MFGAERTEDEVMVELHRLNNRVEHIHKLANVISRRIEQISDKAKTKDPDKFLKKLPEEQLSIDLKEKGGGVSYISTECDLLILFCFVFH